jgi:hypothetical protein
MPDGRLVLRRCHARATPQDLSCEHSVLGYLARAGWIVPEPAGELVQFEGLWYSPDRYVPGAAISHETTGSDAGAAVIWPDCASRSAASASRSGSVLAGAQHTGETMDHGRRTCRYDLAMIERQLSRTGTASSWQAAPAADRPVPGSRSCARG